MQAFQLLFCLAQEARIRNRIPIGVGIEDFQAHINANHAPCRDMFYLARGSDAKLNVVAISALDNPHAFDLLGGESFNLLSPIAYQAQSANAAAIAEGDMAAI